MEQEIDSHYLPELGEFKNYEIFVRETGEGSPSNRHKDCIIL
jgi:hypothetical protein